MKKTTKQQGTPILNKIFGTIFLLVPVGFFIAIVPKDVMIELLVILLISVICSIFIIAGLSLISKK